MLTLASAKIGQAYEFRGELFVVLASNTPVLTIASKIESEYFGHLNLKPFNALKLAVEKTSAEFPGTEIAAVSFTAGVVYCAATGGSRVLVSRDGVLATILESKVGETACASGLPKHGDMVLLSVSDFFQSVSQEDIKIALRMGNSMAAIESFPADSISVTAIKFAKKNPKIFIKPSIDFQTTPQAKKTTLLVGVILLAILAVSIGFGIKQKNTKEKESLRMQEEQKNRELVAMGHFEAAPELFLDLTLLSSEFKGDSLSTSGQNLFVLDKKGKRILGVEIATKKSRVVAGAGKLSEAFDIASYEDRVFVLDSNGVGEVGDEVKNVIEKGWDDQALIHAFAGNMYVLDKKTNLIYRYAGDDDTFGSKQNWLSASTKPDLSGSKSWTFDGAIYILTNSGKVLKFSQGSPQNFSIPSEVLSVDAISASDENESLYILDKTGRKVVVVEKNGKFKAQYSSEKIGEATDLIAVENLPAQAGKIILLTGEKLLSIETKHSTGGDGGN